MSPAGCRARGAAAFRDRASIRRLLSVLRSKPTLSAWWTHGDGAGRRGTRAAWGTRPEQGQLTSSQDKRWQHKTRSRLGPKGPRQFSSPLNVELQSQQRMWLLEIHTGRPDLLRASEKNGFPPHPALSTGCTDRAVGNRATHTTRPSYPSVPLYPVMAPGLSSRTG